MAVLLNLRADAPTFHPTMCRTFTLFTILDVMVLWCLVRPLLEKLIRVKKEEQNV